MKPKTKNLDRGIFVRYAIATLCLISILTIPIFYSKHIDENMSDVTKTYLSEISMQSAEMINREIYADLQILEITARLIGSLDDFDLYNIRNIIINEEQNEGFSNMIIISSDGNIILTSTIETAEEKIKPINVSDREYFRKAMSGETNISETIISRINNEKINIVATPINYKNGMKGVLAVYYNNEVISNSILNNTFDGKGHAYIVDHNLDIVLKPVHKWVNNEYIDVAESYLKGLEFGRLSQEREQLKKNIDAKKSGTIEYYSGTDCIYFSYNPLRFNNWYLISVVPTSVANIQANSGRDDILGDLSYILIIIIALVIYLAYIRSQGIKRLEEQIREQSINDASYRIIMDQTNDILFEYNTIKKTYIHSVNFNDTFGYEPTEKDFLHALKNKYIHPDDVNTFMEMYKEMISKQCLVESEIRIIKADGEYIWTQLHMTGVLDSDGNLVRVIGRIVDIDQKKKAINSLKEKAILDSATGLYNKQTTEDMIVAYLEGEGVNGKHALLIIDIDDFKEINDEHGHRQGDMIITELGSEINKMFRSTDIVGRIGGDEFMVLIKNIEGLESIIDKAKAICNIFNDKNFKQGRPVTVSTSIGIAIYGEDGYSYEDLYEAADQALYSCKDIEKGTFSFYNSNQLKINLW